jgi:Fe-S-cluster containining protein
MSNLFTCPHGHQWEGDQQPALCPVCGETGTAAPKTDPGPEKRVTIRVDLTIAGQSLEGQITVPAGPTRARQMLPVFQSLAEVIVDLGVKAVEEQGEKVSCKKGCGACCRQLVPISEMEARHIRDLVDDLPEPRRSQIRGRFAEAKSRLREAGLLDKLQQPDQFPDDQVRPMGLEYFAQKIACPFLEEESCSIYADRPIACREYLVTSPAENCARPSAETVHCVPLAGKVSNAVARLDRPRSGRFIPWVALVLAPEWAEAHPEEPPPRPGPELLREVFERLAGKKDP